MLLFDLRIGRKWSTIGTLLLGGASCLAITSIQILSSSVCASAVLCGVCDVLCSLATKVMILAGLSCHCYSQES